MDILLVDGHLAMGRLEEEVTRAPLWIVPFHVLYLAPPSVTVLVPIERSYRIKEILFPAIDIQVDKKIYQEEKEYVSIHEAECCLEENLESAFQSDQEGIHLITAQTGLGKTGA